MLVWPDERQDPITGVPIDDDGTIGYWARYRGRPVDRENHSSEFVEGWDACDRELKAEAQNSVVHAADGSPVVEREFEHGDAVGHLFKAGTRVSGTVKEDGSDVEGKATVVHVIEDLGDHVYATIELDYRHLKVDRFLTKKNLLSEGEETEHVEKHRRDAHVRSKRRRAEGGDREASTQ